MSVTLRASLNMPTNIKIENLFAFYMAKLGGDVCRTCPREAGNVHFSHFLATHRSQTTKLCEISCLLPLRV